MSRLKTAAIVGTNWGLTYVRPLRDAGIRVTSLLDLNPDRAQRLAAEHDIPLGTDDLAATNAADLIVLATPANTRPELLRYFQGRPVICEKPVTGWQRTAAELPTDLAKVRVNYGFSFLDTAALVSRVIQDNGRPQRIDLRSSVNLPLRFDLPQWFFEVVSHPLSWLLHELGTPRVISRRFDNNRIRLNLASGQTVISIDFATGGKPGIFHKLALYGGGKPISFSGCYRPGEPWRFSPVQVGASAINDGEYRSDDVWLRANQRSVSHMLRWFQGELPADAFLRLGGFDVPKALWLEHCLKGAPDSLPW